MTKYVGRGKKLKINLDSETEKPDSGFKVTLQKPGKIKSFLDHHVIGQNSAKKSISVSVYNHYKRIIHQSYFSDVELDKSNILMIGGTGTGKTLIAQTLAKFLSVPFTIADATTLTEAGYVGEDVENILVRLLQVANYNISAAERGIIFIDEIDKIGRKASSASITRDVSGEGVQQALLKIIEGTVASIPPKGGRKHPEQNLISINTSNILFICGGSFTGLDQIISSRLGKGSLGFGVKKEITETDTLNILNKARHEDLIEFGIIPELVGRLPIISALQNLSKNDMLRILTEPKNALVKQYKKLFILEGIQLDFKKSALSKIVDLALERDTGARALRSVMEEQLLDTMYEIPQMDGVEHVLITKECIEGVGKPVLNSKVNKKSA